MSRLSFFTRLRFGVAGYHEGDKARRNWLLKKKSLIYLRKSLALYITSSRWMLWIQFHAAKPLWDDFWIGKQWVIHYIQPTGCQQANENQDVISRKLSCAELPSIGISESDLVIKVTVPPGYRLLCFEVLMPKITGLWRGSQLRGCPSVSSLLLLKD